MNTLSADGKHKSMRIPDTLSRLWYQNNFFIDVL